MLAGGLAEAGMACPLLLFAFGSPRREQAARRALQASHEAFSLRIATTSADPYTASMAGPVWLPLDARTGPGITLAGLEPLIGDPWQRYRDDRERQRERERRERAERDAAMGYGYDQYDSYGDPGEPEAGISP